MALKMNIHWLEISDFPPPQLAVCKRNTVRSVNSCDNNGIMRNKTTKLEEEALLNGTRNCPPSTVYNFVCTNNYRKYHRIFVQFCCVYFNLCCQNRLLSKPLSNTLLLQTQTQKMYNLVFTLARITLLLVHFTILFAQIHFLDRFVANSGQSLLLDTRYTMRLSSLIIIS